MLSKHRAASIGFILVTIFLDALCVGLIFPVLPALVGRFTASESEQALWYGLLSAAYGTMQFICTPILGALSDRFGRRPILLISIFGLGCSLIVQATTISLLNVLLFRLVSGGTGANVSVATAYVADITTVEQRSRVFGILGSVFGLGFLFGPLLGGLLAEQSTRLPFFVAASMALLNFLYGFFVLPESLTRERRAPFILRQANPFSALLRLKRMDGVGNLIVVYALTVFAQFTMQTTWVLYTQIRFGWSPMQNGFILFILALVGTIVQGGLQGWLTTKFGEKKLILLGLFSASIAYALYGLSTETWMIYCVICVNIFSYASGPALLAMTSKAASNSEQGLTQGALSAINGVAFIFAPLIGTAILAQVSHLSDFDWRRGSLFIVCSVIQFIAMILAVLHFRPKVTMIADRAL